MTNRIIVTPEDCMNCSGVSLHDARFQKIRIEKDKIIFDFDTLYLIDGEEEIWKSGSIVFEEVDFAKPEDFSCEYSTMGGWAIQMLNADPHVGDSFRYENIFVIVAQMERECITKLTILVEPKKDDEEILV